MIGIAAEGGGEAKQSFEDVRSQAELGTEGQKVLKAKLRNFGQLPRWGG
jgi:hypothetical protein